ncbi:MAG: thioredoxin domain-containing protein [Anaerolineae bacterium]|nr:thioredoxin domain-containing protein [Anaerolineae bacterium]
MSKKLREQRRAKKRQQQRRIYFGIGIAVVAIIAIVVVLLMLEQQATFPEGVNEAYAGIPQGVDGAGFPMLGDPNALIVVEEFSSFGCPSCADLHEDQLTEIKDAIRDGHVRVVFKPIITIANTNNHAERGARAAVCAGEQGKFWEMHDIIFHWQERYAVNGARLDAAAEELGIDAGELTRCYNSGDANTVIARAEQEFEARGFNSTPRVVLNGQEINWGALRSQVDTLVAQQEAGS